MSGRDNGTRRPGIGAMVRAGLSRLGVGGDGRAREAELEEARRQRDELRRANAELEAALHEARTLYNELSQELEETNRGGWSPCTRNWTRSPPSSARSARPRTGSGRG